MIEEFGGDFLQWLRGFFFVAKTGSVSLAALEMGRTQSTISHQIKSIENEFGVMFFDRSKGKMELTSEGKILLQNAISIFELIKEMKATGRESIMHLEGKVTIATNHAIVLYFLPKFINDFKNRHPNINLEIEGGPRGMVLERVESAEADFGIGSLDTVPDGVVYHDLFEARLKLLAPQNNPFSMEKQPTLEQISDLPFIFFPRSSTITPMIEREFSESGLKLNVVLVINNFEMVKKYVELGMGVTILPDYMLTKEDEERLDIFTVDRFFSTRKYGLIMRKRKYLSLPAKAFISSIKPDIQF